MLNLRPQDLAEAVTSLISMTIELMLGLIRARGLAALRELPTHLRLALELRRFGQEFAALLAAFRAGTLPPPPPAPASRPVPASPRPSATPRASVRARTPARAARPRRARPAIAPIPRPPRRTPAAIAPPRALATPFAVFPAPVPRKNPLQAILPSHVHFVTISQRWPKPAGCAPIPPRLACRNIARAFA